MTIHIMRDPAVRLRGLRNFGNRHQPDQHIKDWKDYLRRWSAGQTLARKLERRLKRLDLDAMPASVYVHPYTLYRERRFDGDRHSIKWVDAFTLKHRS